MVVEDHPLVADALSTMLRSAGMDVVDVVYSWDVAVRRQPALAPQIVVLDVSIPPGNGLDAVPLLLGYDPEVVVVPVSATDDVRMIRRALDVGCRGFVSKMASASVIVEALQTAASGQSLGFDSRSASLLVEADRQAAGPVLSERELQVLRLAADGMSNPEIAQVVSLSRNSVGRVLESVFVKFGVKDRTAAVAWAIRSGLLEA
jgi:DNA-binding NarL/FixJ family response regulator